MALDSGKFANQAAAFFKGLSARQRTMIVGSVIFVAGALWLFVTLLARADSKTLYSGMSPDEGRTLMQRLAAQNIVAELSSDGSTLTVPAGEIDKARLMMAGEGLPRSGRMGFEVFDKTNWSASDFVEQVNYQRALEGELERTIESMNGVEAVRVHLALAHDSLFTEQQRDAKAAVLVKLRPGTRLSDQDLNAITFLVSSAVESLKPEDVRVVDADGHTPLLSHGSGSQSQEGADFEKALSDKLVATLEPVVGANHIRANVTVAYDTGSNETTQETYDPSNAVVLSSQISADPSMSGQAAAGVPGSTSNVPQNPQQNAAAATPQSVAEQIAGLRSENKNFGVGKTVRHTVLPAGGVKKISAAVLVDDAVDVTTQDKKQVETRRKRTPDEMKQIQSLAAAAIGIDSTRGDQLAVENLSFSSNPADELKPPPPPTLAQRVPLFVNQWAPVLRYAGLAIAFALLYLLILAPLKKQLSSAFRQAPQRLEAGAAAPALAQTGQEAVGGSPTLQAKLTEGNPTAMLKNVLTQKVATEPAQASRLVQDWLRQR